MEGDDGPIFRDIRRYYCEYCGICRSKKSLICSHILSCHQDEIKDKRADDDGEKERVKLHTCEECGRPFTCPIDDCHSSYRRKDHLNRHLLQHQGKLFECPVNNCNRKFTFQGNTKRHVKEFHDEFTPRGIDAQKQYVCPENGCGKVFKYASKMRKHEDSHVMLNAVEVFCSEPGCMKYFTNEHCLKAHLQSCHSRITCEICGTKQLKKNIKRHHLTHEAKLPSERISCSFKGCLLTFTTKSNLRQHIKAVHFEHKPFACSVPGCDMRFPFKHVRDNHEKSGCHLFTHGDFVEADELFRLRPRGGRKRNCPTMDTLMRKRIVPPPSESDSILDEGPDYVSWLLSSEIEDQL